MPRKAKSKSVFDDDEFDSDASCIDSEDEVYDEDELFDDESDKEENEEETEIAEEDDDDDEEEEDAENGEIKFEIVEKQKRSKKEKKAKKFRVTFPYLTLYEKVLILGKRMEQIIHGSVVLVDIDNLEEKTPYNIATEELRKKVIPFSVKRTLPNGNIELWDIKELSVF